MSIFTHVFAIHLLVFLDGPVWCVHGAEALAESEDGYCWEPLEDSLNATGSEGSEDLQSLKNLELRLLLDMYGGRAMGDEDSVREGKSEARSGESGDRDATPSASTNDSGQFSGHALWNDEVSAVLQAPPSAASDDDESAMMNEVGETQLAAEAEADAAGDGETSSDGGTANLVRRKRRVRKLFIRRGGRNVLKESVWKKNMINRFRKKMKGVRKQDKLHRYNARMGKIWRGK